MATEGTDRRPLRVAWRVWRSERWLEGAAVGTVLALAAQAGLYIFEAPNRERATTLAAWGVIVQAEMKHASAGRPQALRQLKDAKESLAGIVLDGAILRDVDISGMDASYSSLQGIECTRCSFGRTTLLQARLQNGRYKGGCDFSAALLEQVQLNGVRFPDCRFDGATLRLITGDSSTSFNGASLIGTVISNAGLSGAIFENANLSAARISDSDLEGAKFQRAQVSGWRWINVNGANAELNNMEGARPVFSGKTNLAQARFDGSKLSDAIFENVNLHGARFFNAELPGAIFKNCDLSKADFTSAKLPGVRFVNCRIEGAIFRDTKTNIANMCDQCEGTPAEMP